MYSLGEQLKRLRGRAKLTQEELAARARLSRVYVAKLEAGERVSPSFPALQRLAAALGARVVVTLVRPKRRRRD